MLGVLYCDKDSVKIRVAKGSDLEQWAEMRSVLWPVSQNDHSKELADYFSGESIDIVEAFIIETEQAEVAGFIELNIRNFAEGSRSPRVPYVEAWFIRPKFRGKGYGKALMERAESWAIEKGFKELASDTELSNEKSIALHKHFGYVETERVVCFLKRLG